MSTITVMVDVPLRRVLDVFTNALDNGAINHWIRSFEATLPDGFTVGSLLWMDPSEAAPYDKPDADGIRVRRDYFAPLVVGGYWTLRENDDDRVDEEGDEEVDEDGNVTRETEPKLYGTVRTVDLYAVKRGLEIMSREYAHYFADLLNGNDDAETADVLVQCCALGKVIYG